MTKKNKLVPKAFQQLSGATIDRLIEQIQKNSISKAPALNAKVKKTYLNPRFNA